MAVAALATAIACTWPLALHLATAIPLGTESAPTIPLFDTWTLWWSANRFLHGYSGLWDAPIFYPTKGAFAFSEPMLLPGVMTSPLFALHAPPALAANFVLFVTLWANGMLACRCARALGIARGPALLAAVLMVALPFVTKMQGELPVVMIGPSIAVLDAAVRFGGDGRTRHAAIGAAALVAQVLTSLQLALFASLFAGAAALVALAQRRFARAAVLRLGVAALVAGLLIGLVVRGPLRIHRDFGFQRDAAQVQSLSATPRDFLSRPPGALIPFPSPEDPTSFTGGLFPGLIVLALAAYGLKKSTGDAAGPWRWYVAGAAVGAGVLTLGLNVSFFGWTPFATLRRLPGFGEVRSPFRCAIFLQMHLVLLAGLGLSALWRRYGDSRRARAALVAVALLGTVETLGGPARLLTLPGPPVAWTTFIASQPPDAVLAHVPFPSGGDVEDFAREAWRLYAQIDHGRPIVNGYSSNVPTLHRAFISAMGTQFPQPPLACALRRVFHADLLIVDQDWLAANRERFAQLDSMLKPEFADGAVAIYRLQPSEAQCPPMRLDITPLPP
ncbi:MAG TPA: hypothetical protein VGL59_12255 [Polyangia bacterium]